MNEDEFIPTRRSLLERLRSWDDHESWRQFVDTYGRLIFAVASKAGLSDAEAQDVVQETVIVVAKKMPEFKYDPAIGSFKGWLLLISRRRIEKQLKKRLPVKVGQVSSSSRAGGKPAFHSDDTERTATVERVTDPKPFDLEAIWDTEWEKSLWNAALARVKGRVKPKQFQMFDLYVLKEWTVGEVARALNVSATHVYVNKHRISGMIKAELKRLQREL